MDQILGFAIDDYSLFLIIERIIIVFILFAVYLGIQIILMWKSLNKSETNPDKVISNKASFIRSSIFIFMAGFFMIIHNLLEILEQNEPDFATYKLFELMSLLGIILFLNEWYMIFKKLKQERS